MSADAELYVIGAVLASNRSFQDVADIITADDFEVSDNRTIMAEILAMIRANEAVTPVTLIDRMRQHGTLELVGGFVAIMQIATDHFGTASIIPHAKLIREHAMRRKLLAVAEHVAAMGMRANSAELRAALQSGLASVETRDGGTVHTFCEAVEAASEAMKDACRRRDAGEPVGLALGVPCVDSAIGGFARGQLWTIAARPGVGKTAMALQFGISHGLANRPGLMISLEMQGRELATRALALRSGENVGRLFRGYRDSVTRAEDHACELMAMPFHIDAHTRSLDPMIARIGQYGNRKGIQWAIVDHIGLVEAKNYPTRNDQVGAVSRSLKTLAMELDIPIIALSQLNRASEKDARRPGLADLRDSGNIEQDVDGAIFMHRTGEHKMGYKTIVELEMGVLKNRNGPSSWIEEKIHFDGSTQTFTQASQ